MLSNRTALFDKGADIGACSMIVSRWVQAVAAAVVLFAMAPAAHAAESWITHPQAPAADAKRIGISGHSHGGFMSAYALTHSKMFAAGVDSAGPTDWRNYNSIYVERYMTMPADNPDGYDAASVVAAAKNLHGRLLIMHGMMDDNVHVTSAMQLMDALQKANLSFESMLYPKGRHGIGGNFQQVQNEFMKRMLRP